MICICVCMICKCSRAKVSRVFWRSSTFFCFTNFQSSPRTWPFSDEWFLVVCLLSYLTLIYESFKDKNGTKLNGWTAVGSIHKSKEPLLNCIFGDFVTGSLWQKKHHLLLFLLQNPWKMPKSWHFSYICHTNGWK